MEVPEAVYRRTVKKMQKKKKKGQTITNKTQRRKQNSSTPNITKNGYELQCSENKQYLQPV
jgi:hypothetical protein